MNPIPQTENSSKTLPYPHYEQSDTPGLLVRITADGKRSTDRFGQSSV